uniref:Odorant binding protein 1 n=1 Tax=Liriomyza sativae TaxID=127406 RepID=A0A0X8AZ77_LIRSA|nr:odorant binding protein 1 [Liriomyza sativae]
MISRWKDFFSIYLFSDMICNWFWIGGVFLVSVQPILGGVTQEQMMSAGKLMRDVCHPKFSKVSVEQADSISKGIIPDDKDSKCYINCILEMMQMMKKGKFLYESSLKQIDVLVPDDMVEEYRNGVTACKDAAQGIKNNCEASYALLVCFRDKISRFMFP